MKKYEEQLSEEAALLDHYLGQYRRCIKRKRALEARRQEIIKEFDNPLSAISYDGMPKGSGENLGCAALCYRLDEIEIRIQEQVTKATKVLTEIMDIIDFLPENSMERAIIERRYIDRCGWRRICEEEHISRTPANRHWRKGLYELLEFKRVRILLKEYKETRNAEEL
ncbi:MAG: hypothetical protein E7390_09290 [Ruminococcaceae bacterium]|nr:hypothetical protein [Oscillospiraceae bacterium]